MTGNCGEVIRPLELDICSARQTGEGGVKKKNMDKQTKISESRDYVSPGDKD